MTRIHLLLLASALLIGLPLPLLAAFEGDFAPRLQNGVIINDGLSDLDGSTSTDVGVFQYTLGELSPGYTQDPGLQPLAGSGLPGGSFLGFNVLGPLAYWNGTGSPTFHADSAGAQLELYFGPMNSFVSGTAGAQNGFVVQALTSQGAGHRHLNAQLLGLPDVNGAYIDSLGATYNAPASGIYAIPIQITDSLTNTTNPSTYHSGRNWLVYNQGLTDAQLTAAADSLLIPGDANLDLRVDVTDLGVLATYYGQSLTGRTWGDFNNDGHIDVTDLGLLATHYGTGPGLGDNTPIPAITPIPEPSALLLLLALTPFLFRRIPRIPI